MYIYIVHQVQTECRRFANDDDDDDDDDDNINHISTNK
jgi:hypothetical protein